jgi:hypothetical protein
MSQPNGLAEISSLWMWWNQCVKALRMFPGSYVLQQNAAKAQVQLVCSQAIYLASVKP